MIDLDYLVHQTAGDTALQQELLGLFLTQIDDVDRMIEGAGPIESMALADVVHRLRGAAMAVGEFALAASLSKAETCLQTVTSAAVIQALRPALREARSDITRLLPR